MKHFQRIERKWKSVERQTCSQCGKRVEREQDYFKLEAHWAIKKKADEHGFCSLPCVVKWCADDEDNKQSD